MICDECGDNKAQVHFADIKDNKKVGEKHLCFACLQKLGIGQGGPVSIEALQQALDTSKADDDDKPSISCEACGMSLTEFQKEGRFGCANDYLVFREHVEPLLERFHNGARHVGKVPVNASSDVHKQTKVRSLREELNTAVSREEYEEAARLRDELTKLIGLEEAREDPK